MASTGVTWLHWMHAWRALGEFGRECGSIMNQHDFLETTLPTSAKHPGVRSLLAQGVWRRGVADVALAVGLSLSVSAAVAGTVAGQGDARFEPRRPAPVVGRVGMDVSANVMPPVSTAVQVPAPAHLPAAPNDLVAQPVTSPAASDGKGLGRVGHAASTSVATGGTSTGTAKRSGTTREARQVVSRETPPLAKPKMPRSGDAPHEKAAKAREGLTQGRDAKVRAAGDRRANTAAPAEVHARKGAGRVASTRAHHAVAPGAHPAERVRVASSGRTARHAADPAQRPKASQTLVRASRAPTTPEGRGLHRSSRTAIAAKPKQPKGAQVAKATKAKKHGTSLRSAKAVSSSTAPSARHHGV